ncbi:HpcH/HpaI aldolase/citrate lyase family protein [Octadecabacter sp. 1_MG-2023]|uniref:HpcH/HpaI aldolase family protein n=1 Tax=unclassified Octadecabacter TaxID=196158 RepID=UPI001C08757A|nr:MULTISPECIES: HpcH/HpaI aldolase/citrate lyase family protein [unclassified Octadecabacter]MBU2993216.1 HpcH/HpaI aldolase/citrate lyase family protein [Octadecabacter sp. B2R22]MDO6733330.1 HpcH/HpaI aldolase/citrate lyase family protein [Octadecabacter sp. 1_MG-2023]
MPAPKNALKAALLNGDTQCGVWMTLANGAVAEIAGNAGFAWCLIDGEHGPNTLSTIQTQLQALAGTAAQAVVRVPAGEDWLLKQVLDLGAQTIVVPMVNTAEQAAEVAASVRYPGQGTRGHGTRGMGAALARAARYGAIVDYVGSANDQICLFVQIESAEAVENVDAIAAVDGVDGLFVGPADLSADMGFVGQPDAPEVVAEINHVYERTLAAGKIAGTVVFDPADISSQIERGVRFLGVGSDSLVLQAGLQNLAAHLPEQS